MHSLVRYIFDSFAVVTIKDTVWRGLINFNIFFLKSPRLATLQKLGSFNNSGWKKRIFEKVIFSMKSKKFIYISGIIIRSFCWYQIEKVNMLIFFENLIK